MSEENNDEGKQADWNMATAYYMRIDGILSDIAVCRATDAGRKWYKALYALRAEAWPKLNKDERAEIMKLLDVATKQKQELKNHVEISTELYGALDTVELYIRDCMEKHNMLIPEKDKSGFA